MARKSALQKIESHEKLCRIMQKQTFEQIKEIKERVTKNRVLDCGWRRSYINCLTWTDTIMKLTRNFSLSRIN